MSVFACDDLAPVRPLRVVSPRVRDVNLFVLGVGTVGGQLLQQIAAQDALLRDELGVRLNLVGLANSRGAVFDRSGVTLDALLHRPHRIDVESWLGVLGELDTPVLVDCTAADGMEVLYRQAFCDGVHVVAANKKPLSLPAPERNALIATARLHRVAYHYETTVGASLPVIDTLIGLVRTGDRVERITAALSGTLGFLSNEVMAGTPLSRAVRVARERGFTEPDPRDDLGGVDVARKAVILAREIGLQLSLSDVELEPFVPASVLEGPGGEAFFERLEAYDAAFSQRIDAVRRRGGALRYLARIEPDRADGPIIRVGPAIVLPGEAGHDLRGAEALVSFQTSRHRDYPLTVRGAGAGGAVTASGVLTDILRISETLRRR